MIEKLKEHDVIDPKTDKVIGKIGCDLREIMDKLNELVDAVNGILDYAPLEMAMKAESADPYAEQRKWIGKICKFWNWDTGLAHYSKLITIKDINDGEMSNCPFRADDGGWYMYCEPVKPDDDIIYKGGDNE